MKITSFTLLCVALFLLNACKNEQDKAREEAVQYANQEIAKKAAPAGPLYLDIATKPAPRGQEVCLPVTAKQFNGIMSMQYSLKWDKNVLKYKGTKAFNLPGLIAQNFGAQLAEKEGILTHSWYDANVQGISMPDGATVYEICFEAIGATGARSSIEFVNAPTSIEISNVDSKFPELKGGPGVVEVK